MDMFGSQYAHNEVYTYSRITHIAYTSLPSPLSSLSEVSSLAVLVNERGQRLALSPENDSSDPVGQDGTGLILAVNSSGDREDTVKLLESKEFGFGDEEPDEAEGDNVEGGVSSKGAGRSESSKHSGELIVSNFQSWVKRERAYS